MPLSFGEICAALAWGAVASVGLVVGAAAGSFFPGAAGMRFAGRSRRYTLLLWSAIAVGAAMVTATGYAAFGSLGRTWTPHLQAFGAGALLVMTAETMIPEAFHNSPRFSGFVSVIGFCVLLLVEAATH